ncbi:hypothetical protein BC936DRAFT_145257, partial [Jimgerdemannia flammicorona]
MYTSHHDRTHCFEETRDGRFDSANTVDLSVCLRLKLLLTRVFLTSVPSTHLGTLEVRVYGNTIIPRTFFGKFYILCAILRQFHLSLLLLFWDKDEYDVLFVDQLSASVPLLKWLSGAKILFYCHFPDKLLTQRKSLLKKLYRAPVDLFEELTTSKDSFSVRLHRLHHINFAHCHQLFVNSDAADTIVVNSKFTRSIFRQSFPSIRQEPQVLYPAINLAAYDKTVDEGDPSVKILKTLVVLF